MRNILGPVLIIIGIALMLIGHLGQRHISKEKLIESSRVFIEKYCTRTSYIAIAPKQEVFAEIYECKEKNHDE